MPEMAIWIRIEPSLEASAMAVKDDGWVLINDAVMRARGWAMYNCPQTKAGKDIWVGNCAETIPFVIILR